MLKNYFVCLPTEKSSAEKEWKQCLKKLLLISASGNRPLKINIFTDLPDYTALRKFRRYARESIIDTFGNQCPAFNITIHPPEKPWKVIVEAIFATDYFSKIKTRFWHEKPYVVIESDPGNELWAAGIGSERHSENAREASVAAFNQMVGILDREQMSLNDVVRQWNYIGNILEVKDGFQNYQVFNDVRSEFYKRFRTIHGYPAATGVGMKLSGVLLDFCAITANDDIKIETIHNPDQLDAYEYGQQVLKGMAGNGKSAKNPPQFERALLLVNKTRPTLYISGTASIIGQDSIGIGDVVKQTVVTIENIDKISDLDKIGQMTGNKDRDSWRLILLRVYIKNQDDFAKVKSICQKRFAEVPALYVEADICRDNLLVEIEAEFSTYI